MKSFGVFHIYDMYIGGIDAVESQKDLICVFPSWEEATKFVDNNANPHTYEGPFSERLSCGELVAEELPTKVAETQMWWKK